MSLYKSRYFLASEKGRFSKNSDVLSSWEGVLRVRPMGWWSRPENSHLSRKVFKGCVSVCLVFLHDTCSTFSCYLCQIQYTCPLRVSCNNSCCGFSKTTTHCRQLKRLWLHRLSRFIGVGHEFGTRPK